MSDRIDPKRTAFIIMDYQGDILKNVESQVPRLLANAKRALAAARAAKMAVYHVKVAFRPGYPEVSPNNLGFSKIKSAGDQRLVLGTPGAEIHPDVAAIDGEPTIVKHRISPMIDTELPTLLRAREVNHLVMCGVSTSGCILSSVRYAADQDYRMTIVEDCCADPDPEAHAFLTQKLYPKQCAVMTTDAFVASLE